MKSNGTLVVVGLTSLVVGSAITYLALKPLLAPCPIPDPTEKANYVLHFGTCDASNASDCTRVSVVSIGAFTAALQSGIISDFTRLNKRETGDPAGGVSINLPTQPSSLNPKVVLNLSQCESGSPCTMHVTQRVGLNTQAQVEAVLATLRPEK